MQSASLALYSAEDFSALLKSNNSNTLIESFLN